MWQRRIAITVMILLVAAVAAAEALAVPTVKSVRIGQHDNKTRLVLDLTESARFKIFTLTAPDRLVIDMPPVHWALEEQAAAFHRAGVLRVRFGQFRDDTSRIVVDLAQPAVVQRTFLMEPSPGGADAYRLVVDLGTLPVSAAPAKPRQTVISASTSVEDERQGVRAAQPTTLVRQVQEVAPAAQPLAPAEPAPTVARAEPVEDVQRVARPTQPTKPVRQVREVAPAAQAEEPIRQARRAEPTTRPQVPVEAVRQIGRTVQPTKPVRQVRQVAPTKKPAESGRETRLSIAAARSAEPEGDVRETAPAMQPVEPAQDMPEAAPAAEQAEPFIEARLPDPTEPVPLPRAKPSVRAAPHLIAIDAGHGGRDPGAIANSGLQEKVLALTFARELRAELEATGRYRTVMTREHDHKISLHRRVEIARDAGANLFLSIHLDRLSNREVRGASVYTLSDEASDVETAELAARENKADIVADVDLSEGYDEEVAKVLISMVQQNTMNCSAVLAATLLPELGRVAPLISRPHRFGDFRVLKAPDIPSVLVELGFLSNDQDAKRLRSAGHRRILAGAIVEALDTYIREPC